MLALLARQISEEAEEFSNSLQTLSGRIQDKTNEISSLGKKNDKPGEPRHITPSMLTQKKDELAALKQDVSLDEIGSALESLETQLDALGQAVQELKINSPAEWYGYNALDTAMNGANQAIAQLAKVHFNSCATLTSSDDALNQAIADTINNLLAEIKADIEGTKKLTTDANEVTRTISDDVTRANELLGLLSSNNSEFLSTRKLLDD